MPNSFPIKSTKFLKWIQINHFLLTNDKHKSSSMHTLTNTRTNKQTKTHNSIEIAEKSNLNCKQNLEIKKG